MSAFEDNSGKIGSSIFKDILLPKCGFHRKEVIVGPQFGVDTAVIDLHNEMAMAISSDPLSLIPTLGLKESAWLSVHLLVNDMATTGFAPMYAQFVLNLPITLTSADFEIYWNYIHVFCEEIGVSITGGHTCQVEGQNSTISGGGTMFLTAPKNKIITSNKAQNGDVIIVTKETALLSTSILAMSFPETVVSKLGNDVYEKACQNFYRTSSLKDALCATEILEHNVEIKAMHDVTEGGVVGAIIELAEASNCGFLIYNNKLPVGKVSMQIAELFSIDHRFSIGAGSMIIVVKKRTENKLISKLKKENIPAAVVGEITPKESGRKIQLSDRKEEVNFNGKDPYWDAFFNALKSNLK